MKIAIMGIRGIPANYGGFETFADEIGPRLVDRGHNVTVYCRTNNISYPDTKYRGVELVKLPTISQKYLDTPVHTILSVIHGLWKGYDIVLMCNAANALFTLLPRLSGSKVVLNVDGLERFRAKWGFVGKAWCRLGERLAVILPHSMVTDAEVIENYYERTYEIDTPMIPYGSDLSSGFSNNTLNRLTLRPGNYVLYVSRLEPENNAKLVIEAFRNVATSKRLVIVGDAPYSWKYKRELNLRAAEDKRVVMTGGIYGAGYRELQANAYCYIQATEVGGTHPALVEAMGFGNFVIANKTPENEEVLGDTGVFYKKNDTGDLCKQIQWAVDHPDELNSYKVLVKERAQNRYVWNTVVDQYEGLFRKLCSR